MRTLKQFVVDVTKKPPIVMPFVAAAHVLWLLWTLSNLRLPIGIGWLQAVWMVAYAVCWIAACDLRKWGAIGYILLAVTNCALFLLVKNAYNRDMFMSSLFLLDVLFSFYLLFFFKRFNG